MIRLTATRPRRMKPLDFGKSVLAALAIMVVNVAISFLVVAVYSYLFAPGHDEAFYQAAATRIAPWSSIVFGAPLFFVASYVFAKRRPDRNAIAFAASIVGAYALVDVSVLVAAGDVAAQAAVVALSLVTKLVGAIGGGYFGAPSDSEASPKDAQGRAQTA